MRLLLLLLFFGYSIPQYDISFEQYMSLASQNNWPKDEENYQFFLHFCNNASSLEATESEDYGNHVFTRADCILFAAPRQTTEFSTLEKLINSTEEPISYLKHVYYFDKIIETENNACSMETTVTSTTTPPPTTELTTPTKIMKSTLEPIYDQNDVYYCDIIERDGNACSTETTLTGTTTPSPTTELTTIPTTTEVNLQTTVTERFSTQTSTSEDATTSVQHLSTDSSTRTENPQTSTSKSTESQDLESSSVKSSTESYKTTTKPLEDSTEKSSALSKTETSTKPTIVSTEISSATTKIKTDVPSSSRKPTTPTPTTTKSSTTPQQSDTSTSKTKTSTQTATSPTSVKTTKVETTKRTSTTASTKLTATTTQSSTLPSSSPTTEKTTMKLTTPKKPETTLPENVETTTEQTMKSSASTEPSVTISTSVTSNSEQPSTQTSDIKTTTTQADTPTSSATVTSTTPSNKNPSTTVTQGTSTLLIQPTTTASTKNEYRTSPETTAYERRTSSTPTNTVTETTTKLPTQKTSTMPDRLLTDTVTPAKSTTPENYPTTTPDKTASTTLQVPTTITTDATTPGTTLQNVQVLSTSTVNKVPSTIESEQATITTPGKRPLSSTETPKLTGTSSSSVSPTKTSTENLNVEMSTASTMVSERLTPTTAAKTTIMTTTIPETSTANNEISSPSSSSTSSTTTRMPSTTLHEIKTTENVESTTESESTESLDSTRTPTEITSSSTRTTVPSQTENQKTVTSTLPKTTSTSEGITSSPKTSTHSVPQTTSETGTGTSTTFDGQTSTELIKPTTTKMPSTKTEDQTTEQKTSPTIPNDKVNVSPKAQTSSTTSTSESRKSTGTSTEEPTVSTTKIESTTFSSSSTSNSKSTKKATQSSTQSTVQPSESTTSASTEPSAPSSTSPKSPTSTTKKPTSTTTKSPICNSTCPPGFTEGGNACFKFIQANATEGVYYDDFLNACTSMNGVIASLADYSNFKNVHVFNAMKDVQNPKPSMVYTNAVPSKYHRQTQIVPVIELEEYSLTKFSVIGLPATQKIPNVTVICRVGKFCQEYTCPVMEYFIPPTAKYLLAAVPPTTVLKANEKLSIICTGTPKRTFEVKCDERGFLLPDSSMLKCDAGNEIKSEPEGTVKSCAECDKFQTESCQPLPSGEFYCACKELYQGKTCRYPFNACENVTCQNGGTCINRFTYGFCQCETEYFGSVCQYEFYDSYEAWAMRLLAYTVTAAVVVEHAVRTKKRLTPSAPGKFGTLPTEITKSCAAITGTFAMTFRILFEFPDSDGLEDKIQCQSTFIITMTLAFCSLTAIAAESIIALGVVVNSTSNCYAGHYLGRKKCVDNRRLTLLLGFFCVPPFAVLCAFSSDMVTPRSCIGILPWQDSSETQKYAGLGLVALMSVYTLVATGIALVAKQHLNNNVFATRRRYEADLIDPTIYGREILPIELNVRYYLLPLKPLFFTIAWFSFIAAAERMEWWATYLSTVCSGIYGVISFFQNQLTVYDNLDATIVRAMNWLPKKYAPKYNYITLRTRNDYLKVRDPEKFAKEQEEKLNGGPEVSFPIPFNQNLEKLMETNKPGVLNKAAFFKLVPTGLHKIIIKKWRLQYLKLRASGETRGSAIRLIWWDLQNEKTATPLIPYTVFIRMFQNFWDNCIHWDRLDNRDPRSKKVLQRGVEMLEIKPLRKAEEAKVPNSATDRRVTFFRDDPLMDFDQQQDVYDRLEKLCKSFTPEDLQKDEDETAAFVGKYPYYCRIRRSHLTKRVVDNRRRTVHDFLLDERRPNFVGPRTYENQIPPGITYLEHTAYYWEYLNYETWKRLRIRAKYIELNIALRYEFNLWDDVFPWNWEKHNRDPNMFFDPKEFEAAIDFPNVGEEVEEEAEEEDD